MAEVRVTHLLNGEVRLAELVPGTGIVKMEGGHVTLFGSIAVHSSGCTIECVDTTDTITVTESDLQVAQQMVDSRTYWDRRMAKRKAGEPITDDDYPPHIRRGWPQQ